MTIIKKREKNPSSEYFSTRRTSFWSVCAHRISIICLTIFFMQQCTVSSIFAVTRPNLCARRRKHAQGAHTRTDSIRRWFYLQIYDLNLEGCLLVPNKSVDSSLLSWSFMSVLLSKNDNIYITSDLARHSIRVSHRLSCPLLSSRLHHCSINDLPGFIRLWNGILRFVDSCEQNNTYG